MQPIPVLDIPPGEEPALLSMAHEAERLAIQLATGQRTYSTLGIRLADARTRVWSGRSTSPYAGTVDRVARALGRPGGYLMNYSYEWGCTTGVSVDDGQGGMRLWRTLDWPFDGLGRALIVARCPSPMGPFASITWPGFAGVLTACAPGRFAAAINQPPLPPALLGKAGAWLRARLTVNRSRALPPSHLLRLAFETCRSFTDAVALLRDTPICLPAIFTVAGIEQNDAIVIERTPSDAFVPAEACAANHWAAEPGAPGKPRNASSTARRAAMTQLVAEAQDWSLDWITPPILQPDTRLAALANPRTGRLLVQGWEEDGPATEMLDMVV